jgi:hypothetical protein
MLVVKRLVVSFFSAHKYRFIFMSEELKEREERDERRRIKERRRIERIKGSKGEEEIREEEN